MSQVSGQFFLELSLTIYTYMCMYASMFEHLSCPFVGVRDSSLGLVKVRTLEHFAERM